MLRPIPTRLCKYHVDTTRCKLPYNTVLGDRLQSDHQDLKRALSFGKWRLLTAGTLDHLSAREYIETPRILFYWGLFNSFSYFLLRCKKPQIKQVVQVLFVSLLLALASKKKKNSMMRSKSVRPLRINNNICTFLYIHSTILAFLWSVRKLVFFSWHYSYLIWIYKEATTTLILHLEFTTFTSKKLLRRFYS